MLRFRHSVVAHSLLCAVVLPWALTTARGQTISASETKLALKAALVLTPEFCATEMKVGHTKSGGDIIDQETFEIGKAACAELPLALKGVFSSLTLITAEPLAGEAQIVLFPRITDLELNKKGYRGYKQDLDVLLEWTVKDISGKTVWIETVQGTAKRRWARTRSSEKNSLTLTVEDSLKDAVEQSAAKMSSAPELRKLIEQSRRLAE